jgi:hypothetical protein
MKRIALISTVFLLLTGAWGQTSLKKAQKILGNNFITVAEAANAWGAKTSKIKIPFNAQQLESAKEMGAILVPILGLKAESLKTFWQGQSINNKGLREPYYLLIDTNQSAITIRSKVDIGQYIGRSLNLNELLEIVGTIYKVRGKNLCGNSGYDYKNLFLLNSSMKSPLLLGLKIVNEKGCFFSTKPAAFPDVSEEGFTFPYVGIDRNTIQIINLKNSDTVIIFIDGKFDGKIMDEIPVKTLYAISQGKI